MATAATKPQKPLQFPRPRPTRKGTPDRKAAIARLRMQEAMEDERLMDIVGKWYQRWGAQVEAEQKQREQKRQQERAKQEEKKTQWQPGQMDAYQDARMRGWE